VLYATAADRAVTRHRIVDPAARRRVEVGEARTGPVLDLRVRWRAGQALLALAGLLAVAATFRPLGTAPLAPFGHKGLRIAVALLLVGGATIAAVLASLKGRRQSDTLALYAFLILSLDGLGQLLAPAGWPVWPVSMLLIGAVAVAEPLPVALGVAVLAGLLAAADAAHEARNRPRNIAVPRLRPTVAETAGSGLDPWTMPIVLAASSAGLAAAIHFALLGEKRRLTTVLAELARVKHGIGQLEESGATESSPPSSAALSLRDVSEDGRRARLADRAQQLGDSIGKAIRLARSAVSAHAVFYFDLDRGTDTARLRAFDGPPSIIPDVAINLTEDPFAFVLARREPFFATDYPRLLWSLPYYAGQTKVGSLLALPVWMGEAVAGVLVADQLEVQALTGREPALLRAFADVLADAIAEARAATSREELGAEFKAAYEVSRRLAALERPDPVRRLLLESARGLVSLEGGAVVTTDEGGTRYVIDVGTGWAHEFEGREVPVQERTWAAWVLRGGGDPLLLDDLGVHEERMPVLVLDEGGGRAESLLAIPLQAPRRILGALVLTGRRGVFNAAASRVLGILANQAAATLSVIQLKERHRRLAERDGLTGLYNRRAFGELLRQTLAREERQKGRFALVILDLDHFKKLNDTFGHPAGDAALRHTSAVLERHLRKGDQAARYGGEEFVVILPAADKAGAMGLAERVRGAIETGQLVFEGARISVTASMGVAVWPGDGGDELSLLAAADRALYAAKEAGRNRVVAASSLPQDAPSSPPPG
jgi:diguanylate cyclase (GGDEF)-like protein